MNARIGAGLLVATLAGLAPSPAAAAPGLEVALQDDYVFVEQYHYGREPALAEARRLGVTRLRVMVKWAGVVRRPKARKPQRRYDWAAYDSLIADAARHGIRLQLTLTGPAPAWATSNRKVGVRGVRAKPYGQFVRDAAKHFKGRVDRYSIWNEPNWHTQLSPTRTCKKNHWARGCDARLGALYRALYRAGHRSIKAVDPQAQVLFGELAPQQSGKPRKPTAFASSPLSVLRAITCSKRNWKAARRCPGLRADGFAHHPYAFSTAPDQVVGRRDDVTLATLDRLTTALDRLAARGALRTPSGAPMELYLTEHGYMQSGPRMLPEATRAQYLTQSFDRALAHPRVRQLLQYLLTAPPPRQNLFPTQILNHDGTATESFGALAAWSERNAPSLASSVQGS
jgi:hypothetical protein